MVWHSPCHQRYHSIKMDIYKRVKMKIQYENNFNKIIHELEQKKQIFYVDFAGLADFH